MIEFYLNCICVLRFSRHFCFPVCLQAKVHSPVKPFYVLDVEAGHFYTCSLRRRHEYVCVSQNKQPSQVSPVMYGSPSWCACSDLQSSDGSEHSILNLLFRCDTVQVEEKEREYRTVSQGSNHHTGQQREVKHFCKPLINIIFTY